MYNKYRFFYLLVDGAAHQLELNADLLGNDLNGNLQLTAVQCSIATQILMFSFF